MNACPSFLDRLLDRARRQPDAVAIAAPDERVRFGDLPGRIEAVAGRLAERGVGPGDVVGIFLPRSPGFVLGVAAAWWLGAAFVPLSAAMPPARRRDVLDETAARAVLTEVDRAGGPAGPPRRRVPRHPTAPADLAYVAFTSGSTGRPRGVAVEHRGLVPMLDAQVAAFGLGPGSRCLWVLGTTFDASLSDLGTAMLGGATLVIDADDCLRDPGALTAALSRHEITHVDLPPALLRVLDLGAMPSSLETIIVGGEPSPPAVIRAWASRFRVVNVYGPTEATVCSSLCLCDPSAWTEPTIGTPLPGVRYHVLDGRLSPAATGELCIEGDGLARGYLGRPDLTAERFIDHDGRRVYRTGDRVRRRDDGELVFLGRVDRQVKLHGQRVEPAEVEARLAECPGVSRAAVLPRRRGAEQILVAFWSGPAALPPARLRANLAESLPAGMVPSLFLHLNDLPTLESGKIDYATLEAVPLPDSPKGPPPEARRGGLLDLVAEVLGVSAVDPGASFSANGGDSFAVLRLAAAAASRGWVLAPARIAGPVPLADLLDDDAGAAGLAADTLRRDAEEALATLPAVRRAVAAAPGCTLLTGATGFLGARLLVEMLQASAAEVVCLVRAASPGQALERLRRASPRPDLLAGRVRPLCGTLDRPHFGLPTADWGRLAGEVDTVYHSAAAVNLVADYPALRAANVGGTAEVLRLAGVGRAKELHYLSTLSVFVATDRAAGRALESDALAGTRRVYGGYAQSKWAAEWLVRRAHDRGGGAGRTTVFRPGLITPEAATGVGPGGDFLTLFIRGLARLGCLPPVDAAGLCMDVTPVDFAARAVVHLARRGAGEGLTTYHLPGAGTLSLARLVEALGRAGVRIEAVDADGWEARLAAPGGSEPAAAACLALCRAVPIGGRFERWRTLDLFQATGVAFDTRAARRDLAGSGIVCPFPDDALVDRYVRRALGGGGPSR